MRQDYCKAGWLWMLWVCVLLGTLPGWSQQINLATQVKGVLAPVNGGTGLSVSSASQGCLFFTAGTPALQAVCGGSSVTLQTGGVANQSQTLLNLMGGDGIAVTNNGGTVTIAQGAKFGITNFSCSTCGTYELGATIASPTNFSAAYTSTPQSASVSDGATTVALAAPYTAGALAKAYTAAASPVVFTLTAVGATTQTQQQTIQGSPRTFGGVGGAGATGLTVAGNNATLSGASGTLANAGLGNQGAYGQYTANNQKIYIAMSGCGHTFTLGPTSFPMLPALAINFTNQNGSVVALCLYESTNPQSASVTLTVAN